MVFIINLCCSIENVRNVLALNHVQFNNLRPNLMNNLCIWPNATDYNEWNLLPNICTRESNKGKKQLFQESRSQFELGYNLIKVSNCIQIHVYECVCCVYEFICSHHLGKTKNAEQSWYDLETGDFAICESEKLISPRVSRAQV